MADYSAARTLDPDAVQRIRARRHLLDRSGVDPTAIVRRTIGLQAQVPSAPGLALLARTSTEVDAIRSVLTGRELALTWAMRGTLHLVPRDDLHRYAAAVGACIAAQETRLWPKHGVSAEDEERVTDGILRALADGPLERGALAERVGDDLGPEVGELLRHSWGIGLKPAVARGAVELRSRGRDLRLSLPQTSTLPIEETQARRWLAARYLAANAVGDAATFARWSGLTRTQARTALDAVADTTARIRDSIWYCAGELTDPGRSSRISLLPVFDPFTLSVPDREGFCTGAAAEIWRKGGWVSAVIVQDGRALGTWKSVRSRDTIRIEYSWFDKCSPAASRSVAVEEARTISFLSAED
jgi:hypothetical protein